MASANVCSSNGRTTWFPQNPNRVTLHEAGERQILEVALSVHDHINDGANCGRRTLPIFHADVEGGRMWVDRSCGALNSHLTMVIILMPQRTRVGRVGDVGSSIVRSVKATSSPAVKAAKKAAEDDPTPPVEN